MQIPSGQGSQSIDKIQGLPSVPKQQTPSLPRLPEPQPATPTLNPIDAKKPSSLPQGGAAASLSLTGPDLEVHKNPDGSRVITGFTPGDPPPIKEALQAAFPDARSIKVISSSHAHPFSINQVEVDGKPFTTSFLTNGFKASGQIVIKPGHQDHGDLAPGTPIKQKPLPPLGPILDRPEPAPKQKLSAVHDPDGGVTVKGFAPGNPPDIETVIRTAFPDAKQIKLISSESRHPFSTDVVAVDGKLYTASFLTGGFRASDTYSIRPGVHQGE